jgi:CubicO group peptidase (beta-lactamase class C family)
MGQFILEGGQAGGRSILPDDWLAQATRSQVDIGLPGRGYGYQWWTYGDGSFAARGIFGQGLFIDPARQLVIASNGNWAGGARPAAELQARDAFYRAVQQALDAEAGATPAR